MSELDVAPLDGAEERPVRCRHCTLQLTHELDGTTYPDWVDLSGGRTCLRNRELPDPAAMYFAAHEPMHQADGRDRETAGDRDGPHPEFGLGWCGDCGVVTVGGVCPYESLHPAVPDPDEEDIALAGMRDATHCIHGEYVGDPGGRDLLCVRCELGESRVPRVSDFRPDVVPFRPEDDVRRSAGWAPSEEIHREARGWW